ncbi:MAG TPA: hypothetical protein PKA00_20240 [Saprospiraceae bacterium]|nr:hypothetical protein [Saprospiraceae bacterium]HMQ85251.1 hypothetical protein [Saprospiraceae bacterium]
MKTIFIYWLLFFFPVCLLQAQSGWVRAKGSGYVQATVSYFTSDQYFGLDGTENSNASTFQSYALQWYAEHGLSDQLTIIGQGPLVKFNQLSSTKSVAGVGDIQLGVKWGLAKKWPLALSVVAEIPTDDGILFAQAKQPNELGILEQINLPTSDGEWNFRTTLALSKSNSSGNIYGSLYGSINWRTEQFSHQWQSGLELGYAPSKKWWLIAKLQLQESLSDSPRNVSFLYGEGTTFTAFGFTTFYAVNDRWKITASYFDYTDVIVGINNLYNGPTFSLGAALEY